MWGETVFTAVLAEHQNRLPKRVVKSTLLEILQTHPGMALSNLLSATVF